MDNDRGQSLITKYVWVIETIYRRRKISFKELNELWLCDDISRGVDIPKRTFDNWRHVIWDMFLINIVNENRGDYWCSQVHGLCHEDTDSAPLFPDVWAQIEPLIEGLPLVAHNKPFDE
jgi:hypothetical protein